MIWQLHSFLQLLLAFCAILVLSLYNARSSSYFSTFLFLIFIYMLLYDMSVGSLTAIVVAALVSIVVLFVKLSAGLPVFTLLVLYFVCLFGFSAHYRRRFLLVLAMIYVGAIVGVSGALHVDLPAYLESSLYVVSGYNDAMYFSPETDTVIYFRLVLAVIVIFAVIYATIRNIQTSSRDWTVWLQHGVVVVFLVATFKQAFTRADSGHTSGFFIFAPTVIGMLFVFSRPSWHKRVGNIFVMSLIFSVVILVPNFPLHYLTGKWDRLVNYIDAVVRPMDEAIPNDLVLSHGLPENVVAIIGNQPVDIMPWEIATIYANDLNYDPRPIIHSYDVYNEFLDAKNAAKYLSDSAPEFVLFFVGDIDKRYPFSTESLTKLAMLSNYDVIQQFDKYLLLKRRSMPQPLAVSITDSKRARLGETIAVEENGIQLLNGAIEYSLAGRLMGILYQPMPLTVTVTFPDGEERTYRAVKGIVNGGMLVSPFIDDIQKANLFFNFGQGRTVASIRFDSPARWAFQNQFTYTIKTVETTGFSETEKDPEPIRVNSAVDPYTQSIIFDSWYAVDPSGNSQCRWSRGTNAWLYFRAEPAIIEAPETLTLDIIAGTFFTQSVRVLLNGKTVGTIHSEEHWNPAVYSFSIDPGLLRTTEDLWQINELEFVIPDASSPANQGEQNADSRVLGLCLWQMNLHGTR